jgi:TonB-linked SusC/RagA family outer membrane protein
MKKKQHGLPCPVGPCPVGLCPVARLTIIKYVLMTKLAIILILGFTIPSFGNSYGQNSINLRVKQVQIKDALKAIENQGYYRFVYKTSILPKNEKVTIYMQEASLHEALTAILQNSHLTYRKINDKLIAIIDAGTVTENVAIAPPVTGKIVDITGNPLAGVSVQEKGTNNGTTTNTDGSFSLAVTNEKAILIISNIGYVTQEVALKGNTTLNITLELLNNEMQQIVVIGYGTQRKGDVTSSVATVKAENFVKGTVVDAGQLIQGKVAGLSVTAPNGDPTSGTQILLRGNTTLLGANSSPLIIIDGVPGDLKMVAPEDIESMDVLKDGSAAAIYGTRGTNGVIIVTTRRAGGKNNNSVEYNGYVSTQTIARKLDLLTADDYRRQIAEGIREKSWDMGSNTDWMKEMTRTPISHVHNLTFRGGNSKTNYLANLNYRYLEGIFLKSDNQTFAGRLDVNHSMFDDKLKVNIGLLSNSNKYTTTGDGLSFNGYTYRQTLIRNPTSPVRDSAGNWFQQTGLFNYENPLSRLYESDGENTAQTNRINGSLTLTPVTGLKLSALFSYTKNTQSRGYVETKKHISTLRDGRNGFASVGSVDSVGRLMELTAQYSKEIQLHRFTALAGYSYQENTYRASWMQNWDFPTDLFGYSNIGIGNALKQGLAPEFSTQSETNLIGFFGRLTYSYDDKYLLMGSLRYEAASQLYGSKKPWGTFPAISAGWRITKEKFMQHQRIFDDLKLRAGYGVTGTQPTNLFLGVAILGYGSYVYSNGVWIQTLGPTQNPNPDLRWEEKHETNVGLDWSMLKGRISGSVDYYIRRINGLLYDYQVPRPPNLFTTTRANVGKMENKGIEAIVNFTPLQTRDFVWNSSVNFSTNTNKLVSLSNDLYKTTNNYFTTGGTGEPIQTFTNIVTVGKNIGDFYGFKVIDVTDDGKWIYEGRDGKPVVYDDFQHAFEDKKVLGNGLPRYYAGWNNNFRYKQFDLGITMRGAFKYQILNFQRMYYENTGLQQYNRLKSAYDQVFGKAVLNKSMPLEFNSYYVEDGDFWKIDNITLGYNLTLKNKYIHSARIYASSMNTITITGYKGIDPEVNRLGLNPGVDDRDKYPSVRTFTLGVNLNF